MVVREIAEGRELARRPNEDELVEQRPAGVVEPGALCSRDQVDREVDRDQNASDGRASGGEGDAGRAAYRARPDTRRRPAANPGVIGAADADGRERGAVGADRAPALRAGETGFAVGMPVAVTGLDRRHPD